MEINDLVFTCESLYFTFSNGFVTTRSIFLLCSSDCVLQKSRMFCIKRKYMCVQLVESADGCMV